MKKLGTSGQSLILAVLIGLILLITVPVIVFLNQTGAFNQALVQRAAKSRSVAEEGLTHAIALLSASQNTWTNGYLVGANPAGGCPATWSLPLNSASGAQFEIRCTHPIGTDLQPYEENVESVALKPGTTERVRAMQAYVSQITVGTHLSTGESASAALEMVQIPNPVPTANTLTVHWGPIVSLDTALWTLSVPLNQLPGPIVGFPRKFSQGPITGAAAFTRTPDCNAVGTATTSDHREYWACASQVDPPVVFIQDNPITVNSYIGKAQAEIIAGMPTPAGTVTPLNAYFAGPTLTYNAGEVIPPAPGTPPWGTIIYLDGDAVLGNVSFPANATIIVTGNLTLNTPSTTPVPGNVRVPQTAHLEYPYFTTAWPCKAQENSVCPPATPLAGGAVQFAGFIYVGKNLVVNSGWNIDGVVMIGDRTAGTGFLKMTGGALTILYNDIVNHNILVAPSDTSGAIQLQTDVLRDVPTS